MKKFSIALLVLLAVGIQGLLAQDKTVTVKVNPSAEGKGRFYLDGSEHRAGKAPETQGEAKITASADFNGIGGVFVEAKAAISATNSTDIKTPDGSTELTTYEPPLLIKLGAAYAYAHLLQPFGIDKGMIDVYLKAGHFEVGFQNVQDAGQDTWKANVSDLSDSTYVNLQGREIPIGRASMQLDLKILDLLTVRYGMAFSRFDTPQDDLGFGILFDKAFGDHAIKASVGYVVNASANGGKNLDKSDKDHRDARADYDQLGVSVAYTGTFGQIQVMPFTAFKFAGLINKPQFSYLSPYIGWNAGVKFSYKDASNDYDMIGAGIDVGGSTRANLDYKNASGDTQEVKYIDNKGFSGIGLKVWSDVLKGIMGDNYLSFWAQVRFETWTPDVEVLGKKLERRAPIKLLAIGLEQRLVNVSDASVKLVTEFSVENLAPFYVKGVGYTSGGTTPDAASNGHKVYIDLGLDASFTGKIVKNL